MSDLIKLVEAENAARRADHPEFAAGDTINVHVKIREGNKERIQSFKGDVLLVKTPKSLSANSGWIYCITKHP